MDWMRSYMSNRRQSVRMNGVMSKRIIVPHGVPQGSKLGPLLFIVYINDIIKIVDKCKVHLFADDTLIYIIGKNVCEMSDILNAELRNISSWLCTNKLKLNASKTKAMWMNNKSVVDLSRINLIIDNNRIEVVSNIKYLGIVLDNKLDFKEHVNYIIKKIARKVGVLSRLKNILSRRAKIMIYNVVVLPHYNYCATILNMANLESKKKLQILQNRAMRIILGVNRFRNIKSMLEELKWLCIKDSLNLSSLCFIYKLENKLLPIYFDRYRIKYSDIHSYNTRNKEKIVVSRIRKTRTAGGVLHRGVQMYNSLPETLKCVKTTGEFLRGAKRHLYGDLGSKIK
jgi:hypothetical protein